MNIPRATAQVLVLLLAAVVAAQERTIEYGDPSELREVTVFFIDSGEHLDLRNIIRDILTKQLQLRIVEKPEDAAHVILFRWDGCGSHVCGHAIVAKRIGPERLRILSNYRASEMELNDLADEYAKWLVKQLRKASTARPAG